MEMSKVLLKARVFLKLLLTTTRKQAIVLLETVNIHQLKALNEICFNLLSLPLPSKLKKLVKRADKILKK
jgi:hypothetical protein